MVDIPCGRKEMYDIEDIYRISPMSAHLDNRSETFVCACCFRLPSFSVSSSPPKHCLLLAVVVRSSSSLSLCSPCATRVRCDLPCAQHLCVRLFLLAKLAPIAGFLDSISILLFLKSL